MKMRLNQILALESGIKTTANRRQTDLYHALQKAVLFDGFSKVFRPNEESGDNFPPERKVVQHNVTEVLSDLFDETARLVDITATKDCANLNAVADLVVDGVTIATKIPATHLLFLKKHLTDLHTVVSAVPVLDSADVWVNDANSGLHRTAPVSTSRTKKVQRPLVLYPATDKHPAQCQIVTEDVVIGEWDMVKESGAMPLPEKKALLSKIGKLLEATKVAIEAANHVEAPNSRVGTAIREFLYA